MPSRLSAAPSSYSLYLGRYTHRVAIANSRLISVTETEVAFRWKDYRHTGKTKVLTLDAHEFIRRFLLHTLPDSFHRIRHYGFLANGQRAAKLALCRRLLGVPFTKPFADPGSTTEELESPLPPHRPERCPCCGGTMVILHILPGPIPNCRSFWSDTS
jgi:Putative transposase